MSPDRYGVLITCEHGGNRIPAPLAQRFATAGEDLASHRGWDPGALELAEDLARSLGAPLLASTTSRLVVDLNRTRTSRSLFSEFLRGLEERDRAALLEAHYTPYRAAARKELEKIVGEGRAAVHVSVHTFTPVLRGNERRAEVGLLYDPSRTPERRLCLRWQGTLKRAIPTLRVRRNYPYRGTADGLTTALRREFPPEAYLGIELEANQRLATAGTPSSWSRLRGCLGETLAETLRMEGERRQGK